MGCVNMEHNVGLQSDRRSKPRIELLNIFDLQGHREVLSGIPLRRKLEVLSVSRVHLSLGLVDE
jgi:hypothetical protein